MASTPRPSPMMGHPGRWYCCVPSFCSTSSCDRGASSERESAKNATQAARGITGPGAMIPPTRPETIDSSGLRQTNSTRMTWWRRWLGTVTSPADAARQSWREAWAAAAAQPDCGRVQPLQTELEALALPEEEIELERVMLEGLAALRGQLARLAAGLPIVETGHRVIGPEACHFSAPAFMPDEPSQPAGRLLFTGARAVFVG